MPGDTVKGLVVSAALLAVVVRRSKVVWCFGGIKAASPRLRRVVCGNQRLRAGRRLNQLGI
jgi:hypothetical protein